MASSVAISEHARSGVTVGRAILMLPRVTVASPLGDLPLSRTVVCLPLGARGLSDLPLGKASRKEGVGVAV